MQLKVLIALVFATIAVAAPAEGIARDDLTRPRQISEDHQIKGRNGFDEIKHKAEEAGHKIKDEGHKVEDGAKKAADDVKNHHHNA